MKKSTLTPERPNVQIEEIFSLRNPDVLRPLLRDNTTLAELILQANKFYRPYFPATAQPILEAVYDPEEEIENDNLFIILRTELSVDEAIQRLEELEDSWLRSQPISTPHLTLDVEFV